MHFRDFFVELIKSSRFCSSFNNSRGTWLYTALEVYSDKIEKWTSYMDATIHWGFVIASTFRGSIFTLTLHETKKNENAHVSRVLYSSVLTHASACSGSFSPSTFANSPRKRCVSRFFSRKSINFLKIYFFDSKNEVICSLSLTEFTIRMWLYFVSRTRFGAVSQLLARREGKWSSLN